MKAKLSLFYTHTHKTKRNMFIQVVKEYKMNVPLHLQNYTANLDKIKTVELRW